MNLLLVCKENFRKIFSFMIYNMNIDLNNRAYF